MVQKGRVKNDFSFFTRPSLLIQWRGTFTNATALF